MFSAVRNNVGQINSVNIITNYENVGNDVVQWGTSGFALSCNFICGVVDVAGRKFFYYFCNLNHIPHARKGNKNWSLTQQ